MQDAQLVEEMLGDLKRFEEDIPQEEFRKIVSASWMTMMKMTTLARQTLMFWRREVDMDPCLNAPMEFGTKLAFI